MILHLISGGDVGGAKTHIMTLLAELKETQPLRLVVFREGAFAEEAKALDIPTTVFSGGLRANLAELIRLARDTGATLLHSHGSRGNMMAALLARKTGLPCVTTVHSDYRHDYRGRPLAALTFGLINRWALRRMTALIGISQTMTDLLTARRFSPRKIFTLYNGLPFDTERGERPFDRAAYWREHGLTVEPDDVVVGLAARLTPVKNVGLLLSAFGDIAERCPRLKVVVAGDGELKDELTAQARALPGGERIHFAGWMADMTSFYRAIDMNLLTSDTENFPYALIEGARESKATVATRVGGIPALIDDYVSGYLIDPGDRTTLGQRLALLYEDADRRAEMGRRLYTKAARLFSLDAMVQNQRDIYETLLRRAVRPKKKRSGVLVCGAYGRDNTGDDAILEGIVQEIRQVDPDADITVLSRNPKRTRKTHGVEAVHLFHPFGVLRAARRVELFLSGGGNLIQNVTSNRSLWYYLCVLTVAHRMGARVLMYGCGVGPVRGKAAARMVRRTLSRHVEAATLREESSRDDMERLGVRGPKIIVSADPALTLPPAPDDTVESLLRVAGLDPDGPFIAFSLRRWPGFEESVPDWIAAADYAKKRYGLTPVFIPIERSGDGMAAAQVTEGMESEATLFPYIGRAGELIGLYARMRLVVSMRLHALIFASGCGAPLIGVAYDEKVSAFMRYMGNPHCIPFEQVSAQALMDLIDAAMSEEQDSDARRQAVERLRTVERRNVEILGEMLR